jgi:hypothetical protein
MRIEKHAHKLGVFAGKQYAAGPRCQQRQVVPIVMAAIQSH